MIEVQDLCKAFGDVRAVDHISFHCPDGHVTALLGPNGAGKTTTLRMLATVMAPDAGTALIDGHDLRGDPQGVRRTMGSSASRRAASRRRSTISRPCSSC